MKLPAPVNVRHALHAAAESSFEFDDEPAAEHKGGYRVSI